MIESDKTVLRGWAYFSLSWLSLGLFGLFTEVMNGGRKLLIALATGVYLFVAGVVLSGIIAAKIVFINRIKVKS